MRLIRLRFLAHDLLAGRQLRARGVVEGESTRCNVKEGEREGGREGGRTKSEVDSSAFSCSQLVGLSTSFLPSLFHLSHPPP